MNNELVLALEECIAICRNLEYSSKADKEACSQCLGGEIQKIYEEASDTAKKHITDIKNMLFNLQQEAMLEL